MLRSRSVISPKRFEITLSIWYTNSSGAQALSIGKVYGAVGGRIRKIVGQNLVSTLGLQKGLETIEKTKHLKMFGEVSEPLSAEMNEIWLINQTSKIALALVHSHYYRKLLIFQFPLIITYPVSYEVDKAYKVILGLIFEALRQYYHSTE